MGQQLKRAGWRLEHPIVQTAPSQHGSVPRHLPARLVGGTERVPGTSAGQDHTARVTQGCGSTTSLERAHSLGALYTTSH